MIAHISYKNINKDKWDACLASSVNCLLYARSVYLDKMADNWDGLVLNDYEAIMPLTWKKKFGIRYLYQPAFMQQAGIYSQQPLTAELITAFIEKAFSLYRFAEITFNYGNTDTPAINDLIWDWRTNFVLGPGKSYESIRDEYDPSFAKSLRRIRKFDLKYEQSTDHRRIIKLYEDLYGTRLPYFKKKDFLNFKMLCDGLSEEGNVITRIVYDANNNLSAAVMLLKYNQRLYNIISCITDAGKKLEANYFLYDNLLQEFCSKEFVFDFEGSDVTGIAAFYKKFNPQLQPYPFARYNALHPLVKIFKK